MSPSGFLIQPIVIVFFHLTFYLLNISEVCDSFLYSVDFTFGFSFHAPVPIPKSDVHSLGGFDSSFLLHLIGVVNFFISFGAVQLLSELLSITLFDCSEVLVMLMEVFASVSTLNIENGLCSRIFVLFDPSVLIWV
jgi:hypothetical protein